MPTTAEQMVSSDTADAFHQRIKLAYDLTVADCDDHDQAMLRASVAAATFAMSFVDAERYARRPLPQSGGYACDDHGTIPADTARTIAETDYNHEQAMNAIASLLRSHEALRTRADAAERRVKAVTGAAAEEAAYQVMVNEYGGRVLFSRLSIRLSLEAAVAAASGDTATTKDMPARGMDILFASEHETRTRELLTDAIAAEVSHLPEVSSLPGRCDDDLWPAVERALVAVALHYRTTATTEGGR